MKRCRTGTQPFWKLCIFCVPLKLLQNHRSQKWERFVKSTSTALIHPELFPTVFQMKFCPVLKDSSNGSPAASLERVLYRVLNLIVRKLFCALQPTCSFLFKVRVLQVEVKTVWRGEVDICQDESTFFYRTSSMKAQMSLKIKAYKLYMLFWTPSIPKC